MPEANKECLKLQLEALEKLFNGFRVLNPLNLTNKEQLCDQYIMLVSWATSYFNVSAIDPLELWPRLRSLKQEDAKELFILI